MMSIFDAILLCFVLLCVSSPLSQADDEFELENDVLQPFVGNGFLAKTLFSDSIYVAGLYGRPDGASATVSHHARIPDYTNLVVDEIHVKSGNLDVNNGLFVQKMRVGEYVECEETWYAHQIHKNLMVVELSCQNSQTTEQPISFKASPGDKSKDVTLNTVGVYTDYYVLNGSIVRPELPGMDSVHLSVVSTTLPEHVLIPASGSKVFTSLTVIVTSLDSPHPPKSSSSTVQRAIDLFGKLNDPDLFAKLKSDHMQAWNELMSVGISVDDEHVNDLVAHSMYYILSSVRSDWHYSLSPGGLGSNAYNAHVFWDAETWMVPNLIAFYPDLAEACLDYRFEHLNGAKIKAQLNGYKGAMFPWESASSGQEVCPSSAPTGKLEQHISGDVVFAINKYIQLHHPSEEWVSNNAWDVSSHVCQWVQSRVEPCSFDPSLYCLNGVIPPDEYAVNVNNSVFTNEVSRQAIEACIDMADKLGHSVPNEYKQIAKSFFIPFDSKLNIHPEYDGYDGKIVKQADVILLNYPLGMPNYREDVVESDLKYYENVTDPNGPCMTYAMFAIGYLSLGQYEKAADLFTRTSLNAHAPFWIWTETPTGGATNFITGAGSWLQSLIFGYGGLRIVSFDEITLEMNFPPSCKEFKLRGFDFHGERMSAAIKNGDTSQIYVEWTGEKTSSSIVSVEMRCVSGETPQIVYLKQGQEEHLPKCKRWGLFEA